MSRRAYLLRQDLAAIRRIAAAGRADGRLCRGLNDSMRETLAKLPKVEAKLEAGDLDAVEVWRDEWLTSEGHYFVSIAESRGLLPRPNRPAARGRKTNKS